MTRNRKGPAHGYAKRCVSLEVFESCDLNGAPLTVTIVSAPLETLKNPEGKEQTKTVLYFRGTKKLLPLNATNWDSVADIAGDDSDDWAGHKIELYPAKTEMKGKTVDCIRVRAPEQPKAATKQKPAAKEKRSAGEAGMTTRWTTKFLFEQGASTP